MINPLEAFQGQQALIDAYLDTIDQPAFKEEGEESSKKTTTRTLAFDPERSVQQLDETYIKLPEPESAPLLSLVPIPPFMADDMNVNFSMGDQSQSDETSTQDSKVSTSTGFEGWGLNPSITGEVESSSSASRTNSSTAKLDTIVQASQQPQSEGLSKLTDLFASMMSLPKDNGES